MEGELSESGAFHRFKSGEATKSKDRDYKLVKRESRAMIEFIDLKKEFDLSPESEIVEENAAKK